MANFGIFVTNPNNMAHIMGVTKAAKAKGEHVKLFFTWKGTLLAKDPQFPELCKIADEVAICADSYKKMGYDVDVSSAKYHTVLQRRQERNKS